MYVLYILYGSVCMCDICISQQKLPSFRDLSYSKSVGHLMWIGEWNLVLSESIKAVISLQRPLWCFINPHLCKSFSSFKMAQRPFDTDSPEEGKLLLGRMLQFVFVNLGILRLNLWSLWQDCFMGDSAITVKLTLMPDFLPIINLVNLTVTMFHWWQPCFDILGFVFASVCHYSLGKCQMMIPEL